MANWVAAYGRHCDPDIKTIEAAIAWCCRPFSKKPGALEDIREKLHELMWEEAGIIRDTESMKRAREALNLIEVELDETGVDAASLAYNLTWHDWLNIKNLVLVSRAIVAAGEAREDSCGAHFRADFPEARNIKNTCFTKVRLSKNDIVVDTEAVRFTRVKPGETLLESAAAY